MARYIDADKIDLNKYPIGRSLATDWIDIEDVKRAIALTPTADVVPKSEVEKLIKSVDDMLDLVCAMTGLDLTCFGKYAELKKKYVKDCRTCKHLASCEPNPFGICDEYTEDKK